MLFTGAVASAGLSFAAQFLLTRRLPVADFGRLAALLAVINFLTPMGSAGVNYFLLRALWTGRSRRGPLGASLHDLGRLGHSPGLYHVAGLRIPLDCAGCR